MTPVGRVLSQFLWPIGEQRGEVPSTGPCLLLATHHAGYLDPPLLAAAAKRPIRFLAKQPLFRSWKTRWLMEAAGAIPVLRLKDVQGEKRERSHDAMLSAAQSALVSGDVVGLFPEGARQHGPEIAPLKSGAARLAILAREQMGEFPIIPAAIRLYGNHLGRPLARIVIGPPLEWPPIGSLETGPAAALLGDAILSAMESAWHQAK